MMVNSIKVLLRGIVDYAGLFPPAGLTMPLAVRNYDSYRSDADAWLLGRFILPMSRLGEFTNSTITAPASAAQAQWSLSAICSSTAGEFAADLISIDNFNWRFSRSVYDSPDSGHMVGFCVDVVEVKVNNGEDVRRIALAIEEDAAILACYCEVPTNELLQECLDAIREYNKSISNNTLRAKVRTGGLDASGFLSNDSLLNFIFKCHERGVGFKATAGLHHPLRGSHPFTYEPDSACGTLHGFLNLFLAAAFIKRGMTKDEASLILDEDSPDAFDFTEDGISWRMHLLGINDLEEARFFATSFGSCSFTEPLQDLRTLNLL